MKLEVSIDALLANPACAADLSLTQRQLIVEGCAAVIALVTRYRADDSPTISEGEEERLLAAAELAALMRVSTSWLQHNGKKLPFALRLPGSKKVHAYSYTGYLSWVRARAGR